MKKQIDHSNKGRSQKNATQTLFKRIHIDKMSKTWLHEVKNLTPWGIILRMWSFQTHTKLINGTSEGHSWFKCLSRQHSGCTQGTKGKGFVQIKWSLIRMLQGRLHPAYTSLQSLECSYKKAAVGRALAGLCLCPHLAERWCQATLRGACTQFQRSPCHQKASGAVTSSAASQRTAICARRERKATAEELIASLPVQLHPTSWITGRQLPAWWDLHNQA